jgi:hypothetical protein
MSDEERPDLDGSLRDAQDWLRERLDEGEHCPCCTQFAKVYRRRLTSSSARALIGMYNKARLDWVDVPRLGVLTSGRGDECKARYWGLIEPYPDAVREDGSSRVGLWRLTPAGEQFVLNKSLIPKHALVYDTRLLSLDDRDGQVSIVDCLGKKFNYRELMDGV